MADPQYGYQDPLVAEAQRRSAVFDALYQRGSQANQGAPIVSPWQGLAALAQELTGAYLSQKGGRDLNKAYSDAAGRQADVLQQTFGGGVPSQPASGTPDYGAAAAPSAGSSASDSLSARNAAPSVASPQAAPASPPVQPTATGGMPSAAIDPRIFALMRNPTTAPMGQQMMSAAIERQMRPATFVGGPETGWTRIGPNGENLGQVVGPAPQQWQNPAFQAFELKKALAGKPTVNTQIDMPSSQQATKVQEWYGDFFNKSQQAGIDAQGKLGKLKQLDNLLSQVQTGTFAESRQAVKKAAKGAGIDLEALGITDNVGPAEAAQALSSEMALELRSPAGGAGMPGSVSDRDVQFLQSMTPTLSMTAPGRKLLIGFQEKLATRATEVAKLAREYAQKSPGHELDSHFFDQLQEFSNAHPLAPDMPQLSAEEAAKLPPGTAFLTQDGRPMVHD